MKSNAHAAAARFVNKPILRQMLHGGESVAHSGYGPVALAIASGMPAHWATPLMALAGILITLSIGVLRPELSMLDLFAVAGVVARFWAYHQTYDNLSVVFLLVALGKRMWHQDSMLFPVVFAAVGVSLWLPAKMTDTFWFQICQFLIWIAGAVLLLVWPERSPAIEMTSMEQPFAHRAL